MRRGSESLGFPGGLYVKNMPAIWETWVQSLGWEDPLERNGYPLQYSCLENSMDRGAWQATVHAVAKSQTRLRDFQSLSSSTVCRLSSGWLWLGIKVVFQEAFAQPKVSIPRVDGGLSSYRRTQSYCYI